MTVIDVPTSHNINQEVGYSDSLMMEKTIIEENNISFRAKGKDLDDEDSLCFVLGYN